MRGCSEIEQKGPRELPKIPRIQVLLTAEHAASAAPLGHEPLPVLNPPVAVPDDIGDTALIVRMTPVSEDEVDLATEHSRDVILMLQNMLAILLSKMSREVLRLIDHRRLLSSPVEAKDVVGTSTNGHRGRDDHILGEVPLEELVGVLEEALEVLSRDLPLANEDEEVLHLRKRRLAHDLSPMAHWQSVNVSAPCLLRF